jgi:hypothetical protein
MTEDVEFFTDSDGYRIVSAGPYGDRDMVRLHRLLAMVEHDFDEVVENDVHHIANTPIRVNTPENLSIVGHAEHKRLHRAGAFGADEGDMFGE